MAVAYESHASNTATNTNSVTVNKPSNLAVGNLMVAFVGNGGRNDPANPATLTGWTQIGTGTDISGGFDLEGTILAKIADSSDVAATNFTFSLAASTDVVVGAIFRLSGNFESVSSCIQFDIEVITGASVVGGDNNFPGTVDPSGTNTVLIMGAVKGTGSGLGTMSGYSITNNNPSWTERVDISANFNDGSTNDFVNMGLATATYSAETATGSWNVNNDGGSGSIMVGFLVSVNENVSVTVSPAVVTSTASIIAPTVTGSSVATPAVIGLQANIQAPTITTQNAKWVNDAKSATSTFVNPSKS